MMSSVLSSLMPSGVEHGDAGIDDFVDWVVLSSLMPSGVEHTKPTAYWLALVSAFFSDAFGR